MLPIGRDNDEAVAKHRCNPHITLFVKGKAIYIARFTQPIGAKKLLLTQVALGRENGVTYHAPLHRFGHIQVAFVGVEAHFVGEVDAIGDDARALLVQQNDIAIGARSGGGHEPNRFAGGDRNPEPVAAIHKDKVDSPEGLAV